MQYQPSPWTVKLAILTPEEIVKRDYTLPSDCLLHWTSISRQYGWSDSASIPLAVMYVSKSKFEKIDRHTATVIALDDPKTFGNC